jgi:plastocyanin
MKRLLALLFACIVVALVAAGCGGDDDNGDSGSSAGGGGNADTEQPAPTAEDNGGTSAGGGGGGGGGGGKEVDMKDIKFNPGTVKIKPGGKVTWVNHDSVGHDVTADGFSSGSPGGIDDGASFTHTFKKAGSYKYVCSVHPGMEGEVVVKKG